MAYDVALEPQAEVGEARQSLSARSAGYAARLIRLSLYLGQSGVIMPR